MTEKKPNKTPISWTLDDIARLKELAKGQGSAGEIGEILGKTRSSIIGKLYRLGIPLPGAIGPRGPRKFVRAAEQRARPSLALVQAVAAPKVVSPPLPPEPPPRVTAAKPREGHSAFSTCQWYFGDPKAGDRSKCSAPTAGSSSFCEEHHSRVYVPVKPALPKRRA